MRILLITHCFPPLNSAGSLRVYSWAKYWSRAQCDVTVITTRKKSFDGPLNLAVNEGDLEQLKVIEVDYWPFRGKNSFDLFAQQSFEKKIKTDNIPPQYILTLKNMVRRLRRTLIGSFLDIHDFWVFPAVKVAESIYLSHGFDMVVTSYGPPACHIIGGVLKRKLEKIFWVADYRDLWYGNHLSKAVWPLSVIEKKREDFYVSRADLITTVSDPLKKSLEKRYGEKVLVIENGFDLDDLKEINNMGDVKMFPGDGKIRLVYTGTIYPGKRDPSPLFEAVNILRKEGIEVDSKLEIIFYGINLGNLFELTSRYKVENIVKTPGFLDRTRILRIQQEADALIFLEWEDSSVDGIVTSKLFEYMYAGTPVLGIGVSNKTLPGRLIEESGVGYALGRSVTAIAEVLKKMIKGEPLFYSPQKELIFNFTREKQAYRLLGEIEKNFRAALPTSINKEK